MNLSVVGSEKWIRKKNLNITVEALEASTCNFNCIERNYLKHTSAEPDEDDDDLDTISSGSE